MVIYLKNNSFSRTFGCGCFVINLDRNTKFCYTYDSLGRVTKRITKNHCDAVLSEESYTYDAAGNITGAPSSSFQYDTNNRLTKFNGSSVSYDLDGNMLSNGMQSFTYDSSNRLISADGSTYTYNAEDVRIRQHRYEADTTYLYDTNCKLSKLLCKTTNGIVTKYVYGLDLIGEEKESCFKTYHFDSRGSTIAITNENCTITDTLAYDTYGKVTSHVGSSFVIFGYNGRDGVVTDANDLTYMRARYYSPKMRRFINADIIPGDISDSTSLNRYAYVNGNPVSYTDPMGLESSRGNNLFDSISDILTLIIGKTSSWDEKMDEIFEPFKNKKSGEVSLIDNNRKGELDYIKRKKGYLFHEQFFVLEDTPEFLNAENGTFSIVSFDIALAKGKWVTKNGTEIALLDFGQISFDVTIDPNKKTYVDFNSSLQIWNPSITFDVAGSKVTIDFSVGGESPALKVSKDKVNIGLGSFGIGIER